MTKRNKQLLYLGDPGDPGSINLLVAGRVKEPNTKACSLVKNKINYPRKREKKNLWAFTQRN